MQSLPNGLQSTWSLTCQGAASTAPDEGTDSFMTLVRPSDSTNPCELIIQHTSQTLQAVCLQLTCSAKTAEVYVQGAGDPQASYVATVRAARSATPCSTGSTEPQLHELTIPLQAVTQGIFWQQVRVRLAGLAAENKDTLHLANVAFIQGAVPSTQVAASAGSSQDTSTQAAASASSTCTPGQSNRHRGGEGDGGVSTRGIVSSSPGGLGGAVLGEGPSLHSAAAEANTQFMSQAAQMRALLAQVAQGTGGPAAGELGSATRNLAAALARNLLYQQQQQQQQDDAATKGLCAPSSTAHASVSPAADAIRVSADRQCDSATAQHGAQVPHAAAAIAVAATVVPQSVSTSSSTLKDGSLTISTSHRLGPKEDPPACTCDVPLTSASAPGAGTPRASFPTAQPDAGTSASWGASGSVRSGGPGVSAAAAVGEGVGPAFFGPGFGMMPGMSGIMQQAQRALSQLSALSTQAADMQHALGALPQVVSRLEALESVWSAELGALRSTAESLQASHERVEERLALLEGRLADAGAR